MKRNKTDTSDKNEKQPSSNRNTLTYVLTVALLVVVVVAFVGAPAITGLAGANPNSLGFYGDEEILPLPGGYLVRQAEGLGTRLENQGQQVTAQLHQVIWREAFQRTVRHLALLDYAEEAGLGLSTRGLDRAMAQWPEFRVAGRFDDDLYEDMDNQRRSELRDFLEDFYVDQQVRADLSFSFDRLDLDYDSTAELQFLINVFGAALGQQPRVSAAEQSFLIDMAGPERQFDFVQFAFSNFPEDQVIEYGRENQERFRRADLSTISVTTSEDEAERIRQRIVDRQATFEDTARTVNSDLYAEEGGDMGLVYYHELEPDFEDPGMVDEIFALEEGEISPVMETTFGWAIYRMDGEPMAPDFDDPEVIEEIRNYMSIFERGLVEDYLTEEAERFAELAEQEGFETAAAAFGRSPAPTEYFPINYGNLGGGSPQNPAQPGFFGTVRAQSNQVLAEGANRDDFFRQLFSLENGDVTEPIVIRDYVFVFSLADEREVAESRIATLETSTPAFIQELSTADIQRAVVDDDKLEDNFRTAYRQIFYQ